MKRDAYKDLVTWKSSPRRKPLLVRGARQTGKTFLLREFGEREYRRVHYCDFEEDPSLARFFEHDLDPHRILVDLGIYLGQEIRPETDLLILDEIQAANRALTALKYFQEQASNYHVATAGSLLGVKTSVPGSFPVGKVSFLDLHPMTFTEFLDAMDESRYRSLLEEHPSLQPIAEPFHTNLIKLLRTYLAVGGMPEVVSLFVETGDPHAARVVQREIIDSYVLDFAKHASPSDIPKLTMIWDSVPRHLAQENKKLVFSAIKKGARTREFESALRWLEDADLLQRCRAVSANQVPLEHYANASCFKEYVLDVGLLGAMARSPIELMVQGERLFNEYEGALVENYAAQQLTAYLRSPLFYWRSRGGKAEVDFVLESQGSALPLEVKAGLNPRSKSLRSFDDQFNPHVLLRSNLLNFKRDGKVCNLPLYALSQLERFASTRADGI